MLGIVRDRAFIPPDTAKVVARMKATLGAISPIPHWEADVGNMLSATSPHTLQDWWNQKTHMASQKTMREVAQGLDVMRTFCQIRPHATTWLAVVPCQAKRHLIPTVEVRCLLRWSLGMDLLPADGVPRPCPRCNGRAQMDLKGHHLVCCQSNHITRRHHGVVDSVVQVARTAGFTCRKEEGAGDGSRPGDAFIPRLNADGSAAIDVTIRDPLAQSHPVSVGGLERWHQMQEAEKGTKYGVRCRQLGWQFFPFVMDVWGGMGDQAQDLVKMLLKGLLGQKEGWQRREAEAGIWQSLSFSLMREIAKQLVWSVHGMQGDGGQEGDQPTNIPYC